MTAFVAYIRALGDPFLAQSARWILGLPIMIGIGIALYFTFPSEPSLGIIGMIAALGGVGGIWGYRCRSENLWPWLMMVGVALLFVGMGAAAIRTQAIDQGLLPRAMDVATVTGTIASIERMEEGTGARVILKDLVIERIKSYETPNTVRIKLMDPLTRFQTGDRIAVLAQLHPPEGPAMPGAYDFARHAFFQGIGAYGFAFRPATLVDPAPQAVSQGISAESIRNRITQNVDQVLNDPEAPIVIALLTGERAAIADADWDALRNSGLAHLLAISGMNVDMVAAIVFFIVRLMLACVPVLRDRWPIKAMAAVAAFSAAALYVWMIVPSVPTQRSLVMIALVLLAVVLGRSPFSLRLIAIVATVILVIWPEQLLGASFQLSFAAVLALVTAFEVFQDRLSRLHARAGWIRRAGLYVAVVVLTTVIATLATAPFSLYNFQSLAVYGVAANALAVPLSTFYLMPLAIFYYVLAPFGAGDGVLTALSFGIDGLLAISHHVSGWPHSVWTPAQMPFAGFLCFVCAGLWLCAWRGRPRLLALPIAAAGVIVFALHTPPDVAIAREGKIILVRFADGSAAVSDRRQRRLIDDYARIMGVDPARIVSFPRHGMINDLRCDPLGCVVDRGGMRLALARRPESLSSDKYYADISVIPAQVRQPMTIGLHSGRAHIESVPHHPDRPWR